MKDKQFDLERFVTAQDPVIDRVRDELRLGHKQSHWMWFVFPQIAGLGMSEMSRRYAISDLAEARAYLDHSVLGPRLLDCTELVLSHPNRSAPQVLGEIDAAKFRSCMTLFEVAEPAEPAFGRALDTFFAGERDAKTLARV